jgi:uncharacterized OB-fold protein
MSEHAKPVPTPTDANRPYWSGCAEGRLRLRRCRHCGRRHAPTRAACSCGGVEFDWVDMSGRGRVFSYTVIHRAPDPAFRAELPYVIAIVEFDEGGRLMSNITGCAADAVRIGMPVRAVFETVAEGIGVPKFQPVGRSETPAQESRP